MKKKVLILVMILFVLISIPTILLASTTQTSRLKIVLDPGHGGSMPGSVNREIGLIEKDLTLQVARYLRDFLNQYDGVEVIMTHDGNLPNNYELELPARGMVARNNKADLLLSLHFNATTENAVKEINGAEVFVTANKLLPKYNEQSTFLGNKILNNLSNLGIKNRGVTTRLCNDQGPKWEYSDGSKADYYAVIRYPMKGDGEDRGADLAKGEGIPGVLIEHCFIRGFDQQFIDSEQDLYKLAVADGKALVEQYGLVLKDKVVQNIYLDKEELLLAKGELGKLEASIEPETAENKNIKWTSSNEKIAIVDQEGNITAKEKGMATITATTESKGLTANCKVKVEEASISITNKNINLLEGNLVKLNATFTPYTLLNKKITWKSLNEEIAIVTEEGIVETKKEGQVTIKAILDTNQAEAEIIIKVHGKKENQTITIKQGKVENGNLLLTEKMEIANVNETISLSKDLETVVISTQKYLGTNTLIQIRDRLTSEILQEYNCLIKGDINGDGMITAGDYVLIKNHIITSKKITDYNIYQMADYNSDTKITAGDYVLIKNYIIEKSKIGE